jgi:phage N-6-adenine-methyltransferase
MPWMSDDEYRALKASVAERGIDEPIVVDEDGNTVDGHNRERVAKELGIDCPRRTKVFSGEADKFEYILEKNLDARRHMTREERDTLIARLNGEGWSIRRIADRFKVSVGTAHAAATSVQNPNSGKVKGKDDREYQARRPNAAKRKPATPAKDETPAQTPAEAPKVETEPAEWETPQPFYDELDHEFHFELDVCASRENAKCERYFTAEDDGLSQDWGTATCFMNPPYGRSIGKWLAKALEASRAGARVVALVPAKTDTFWWHHYATQATDVRFVERRLTFGESANPAPFPSAVLVFEPAQLAGPRQSRGLHRMSECAWRRNLAPGLDQRARVA